MSADPSWECPVTAWVERSFVVYSNFFFFAPFVHCLYALCHRPNHFPPESASVDREADEGAALCECKVGGKRCEGLTLAKSVLTMLPEMTASLAILLVSSIYHLCSDGRRCTQICVADWDYLYQLDFMFSFQMLFVAILYTRDIRVWWWKWGSFLVGMFGNVIFARYILDPPANQAPWMSVGAYYGVLSAACVVLWLLRTAIQGRKIVGDEIRGFRKGYAMMGLVCGISAIYFQVSTQPQRSSNDYNHEYWWKHSLWHVTNALAVLFRFLMIPPHKPNSVTENVLAPNLHQPLIENAPLKLAGSVALHLGSPHT